MCVFDCEKYSMQTGFPNKGNQWFQQVKERINRV